MILPGWLSIALPGRGLALGPDLVEVESLVFLVVSRQQWNILYRDYFVGSIFPSSLILMVASRA